MTEPSQTNPTPAAGSEDEQHEHGHWGYHDHSEGMYGHIHDDPFFHTHPGEPEMVILTPEEAGNRITLTSVGIDIGSSTSHLMFSRLVLERQGIALSSRFKVIERAIVFRSPILLTPYTDATTIDTEELQRFIEGVYKDAGMTVADVDTGATIFTGEAAKKSNAVAISALFAQEAGKFVCAVAGPNLEAVMAAYGSGACARSAKQDGVSRTVLNVDMGGGTAKLAICKDGEVLETAAINVGARLIAMEPGGQVARVEPAGQIIADELGIGVELGTELSESHQEALANLLAECLYNVAERRPLGRLTDRLMITGPLTYDGPLDAVSFSGGVSEYVYGNEPRNFGDLGILLGKAVNERVVRLGVPMESAEQMIRATVIGAGQYTLQVSGSTIFITRSELLPHRNLQVVAPVQPPGDFTLDSAKQSISQAFQRQDIEEGERAVALSFRWRMEPSYDRVKTMAEAIVQSVPNTLAAKLPLVVVFDTDIGGAVGSLMTRELLPNADIVSIDEVDLGDLDFIDLGEELEDVHAVPVVVKSLVFFTRREAESGLVRGQHAHDHDHGHDHDHDHNGHDHTH